MYRIRAMPSESYDSEGIDTCRVYIDTRKLCSAPPRHQSSKTWYRSFTDQPDLENFSVGQEHNGQGGLVLSKSSKK